MSTTLWPIRRTYHSPSLELGGRTFEWGARTYLMAVINATPDSFSGDGIGADPARAAALARQFEAEGADIIDIGGESSRPDATVLSPEDELARVLPVVEAVRAATTLPVSIDTYHASVARAALTAGADAVNDISGLRHDPDMAAVVAEAAAPLIAMHNQRGRDHHGVVADISSGWHATLALAATTGIPRDRIILDPGFGFGWKPEQNLEMLRRLPELAAAFDAPMLAGTSRKSTIGFVLDLPVDDRFEGTAATVALSIAGGADIVRVHDVREMARVARMTDAIVRANWVDPR